MTTRQITETAIERPSQLLAAEIRAEMGRAGINQSALARRMHVGQAWLSRRIGAGSQVDLTFEEVVAIARALNVPLDRLVGAVLPRLDSNQQPFGYLSPQVRPVRHLRLVAA